MGRDGIPLWVTELTEHDPELVVASAKEGRWLVPQLQAGPRKAHYVLRLGSIRTILLCGDPMGMMRWADETQVRDGRGRPWRRCDHCSRRAAQLAAIPGQPG